MSSSREDDPQVLSHLVLAYLCHNCHVNTARAFAAQMHEMQTGSFPASSSNPVRMRTGLETGYGTRAVERDLFAGVVPAASSDVSVTTPLSKTDAGSEPILVEMTPETLSIPPPTIVKDSDGDDFMTPSPHAELEEDDAPNAMSQSIIMQDGSGAYAEDDMLVFDTETGPSEDFEVIEQPNVEPITITIDEDDVGFPTATGLESEDNLQDVSRRKLIREHVLWGRIKEATEMIEEHYPDVIHDPTSLPSKSSSAAPTAPPLSRRPSTASAPQQSPFLYPQSLDPAHIHLNLRIQLFIETVRSRPLAPPPRPPLYITPHHTLSHYTSRSPSPPPAASTTAPSLPHERTSHDQNVIIHLGKELAQIVNSLPDPTNRADYLKALDGIWALMAYSQPESTAPAGVREYLQYEHRLALADQINSAILLRTGHNPRSVLEQRVRSTGAVWNAINERDIQIPADQKRYPPGVHPPPMGQYTRLFPAAPGRETVPGPPFDFARFIDSR